MKLLFALCILLLPLMSLAGQGLDELTAFSKQLKSLQAGFIQTTIDENYQERERTTGKLYLQKPGKFFWHYTQPFEQQIISDGEKLFIYDVDLEQVTIRAFDNALGTAPISLLTDIDDLSEQFYIVELGAIDGRQHLQLQAKVQDTDYSSFLLALGKNGLETMELRDRLGQVTRIELIEAETNAALDSGLFNFSSPNGVDVIDTTSDSNN